MTVAGVTGLANIASGVIDGVVGVGKGIGTAATTIVTKKYGNEAGKALDSAEDIIGNGVCITTSVKNGIVNELREKDDDVKK